MYHYQYVLNGEDYLALNLHHHFQVPESRKRLNRVRLVFPVLMVLIGPSLGRSLGYPQVGTWMVIAVAALLWLLFYDRIHASTIRRSVQKSLKKGALPQDEKVTITFEEEFFTEQIKEKETRNEYTCIRQVMAGESAFYLYHNGAQVSMVPYRIFSSDQEKNEFGLFLQEKVKEKGVKTES